MLRVDGLQQIFSMQGYDSLHILSAISTKY